MNPKIKILIILPDGKIHKLKLGSFNISFREAPLTATFLAALIPDDINADVKIIDESVEKFKYPLNFDLVAISCLTGTSTRAYEIADFYRSKNITVVLGGVHTSLLPAEAKKHADSIVIGFAEKTWPSLLRDFVNDELKSEYKSTKSDFNNLPAPRRDLQKNLRYGVPNTIYATRGCRSNCDFCSVPAANYGWKTRPVNDVINELKQIKSKQLAFNDVNLTDDTDYAKKLLKAMIPLKKRWGGLASTVIADDDELLDLLQESGCFFLLLGFESINQNSIKDMRKGFNKVNEYAKVIKKLHDRKIIIQGCFIFGLDSDTKDVFQDTVDFADDYKIDIPRYAIYTPFPGTEAYKKLDSEKRLLHKKWEYYDTQHVVYQPKNMSPEELDEGFKQAFKKSYTLKSNLTRNLGSNRNFPITFAGNLAYKLYIRRLLNDKDRFPKAVL